jgi:hypothetical protein
MTKNQIEIFNLLIDRCQSENVLTQEIKELKTRIDYLTNSKDYIKFVSNAQFTALNDIENQIYLVTILEKQVSPNQRNAVVDYETFINAIKKALHIYNKTINKQ